MYFLGHRKHFHVVFIFLTSKCIHAIFMVPTCKSNAILQQTNRPTNKERTTKKKRTNKQTETKRSAKKIARKLCERSCERQKLREIYAYEMKWKDKGNSRLCWNWNEFIRKKKYHNSSSYANIRSSNEKGKKHPKNASILCVISCRSSDLGECNRMTNPIQPMIRTVAVETRRTKPPPPSSLALIVDVLLSFKVKKFECPFGRRILHVAIHQYDTIRWGMASSYDLSIFFFFKKNRRNSVPDRRNLLLLLLLLLLPLLCCATFKEKRVKCMPRTVCILSSYYEAEERALQQQERKYRAKRWRHTERNLTNTPFV